MTLGLSSKFNILRESPLDHPSKEPEEIAPAAKAQEVTRWVASRYNVQTTTQNGRLIVWNTFKGSISTFRAEQRDQVRSMLTRRGVEGRPEGLIAYLRDRNFLVPEGTNEYRIFQRAFGHQHYRQDILELTVMSSEDCNFRCQYCYEDFARGTMKPRVREGIKKFLESRRNSLTYLTIGYFGGEPLYGWEAIEDLAPFFREFTTRNSLGFHSHMTTNGYLLTPDVAEKLLAWGILHYQITLDGPPEHHNRNRPGRNGEPTFEVIFRNLQELRRRPEQYVVELRINFDQQSRPDLSPFVELLGREFGGDERFKLRLRPVGRWGGSNDENLAVCGLNEAEEAVDHLAELAHRANLGNCDDLRRASGFGAQVCYAARPYHFIVGADGLIMKCTVELDKKDRNIVGRLDDDGTLHIDDDRFALWTEPAFSSDAGCQKCVVLPMCQGISCPLIRIEKNRSPCIPQRMKGKKELRGIDNRVHRAELGSQ